MSPKQNILALIAALLFSITMASMDFANTAALATNASPPTSTTWSAADNTFSEADDPIVSCEVNNYKLSYLSSYNEVANHLRNMPGNATLGNKPGGGWCLRYSCSNSLAIYGCNDNQTDTQVPWATMATYADAIKGKCKGEIRVHGHWKDVVLGQAFDTGGWNVILGHQSGTNC
ncbi:hypothetical protein FJTKL_05300 [Diaporthe vaccinii]|uniref:Ecp2 effector protein domain-containing protein n=1 Tax=Diaporthe vaccinii TaxID=105482 RepID=A0ABR4FFB0_9PEZI